MLFHTVPELFQLDMLGNLVWKTSVYGVQILQCFIIRTNCNRKNSWQISCAIHELLPVPANKLFPAAFQTAAYRGVKF